MRMRVNKLLGYEKIDGYEVDDEGNVYSYKIRVRDKKTGQLQKSVVDWSVEPTLMKQHLDSRGYHFVVLGDKDFTRYPKVHRLVALAFIPNEENKPTVNHINPVKTDNRVFNLEWATYHENMIHAVDNGLRNDARGENNISWQGKHPNCKVVMQMDLEGNKIEVFPTVSSAARKIGKRYSDIARCCRGERPTAYGYKWKYV